MRRSIVGLLVVVASIVAVVPARPVRAATFACPSGDVACLTTAINMANGNGEDDKIRLEAGTYTLTEVVDTTFGFANGLPPITSHITIRGGGAHRTIIERDANAAPFRILSVASTGTLILEKLTITGGRLDIGGGGGMDNDGTAILKDVMVRGNFSGCGGGIQSAALDSRLTVRRSLIIGNETDGGGGVSAIRVRSPLSPARFAIMWPVVPSLLEAVSLATAAQ